MGVWQQTAATILQRTVALDNPVAGTSLQSSLQYFEQQMVAQAKTVKECTIGSTVTADAANVGTPKVVVSLVRADGLIFQNTVAEASALFFTADSYTGGATLNQEPWQWQGAQNLSSLGTGVQVGIWDWDWPQGSGMSTSGFCIAASQNATTTGNLLTNGDMEDWDTTGTPFLDYWYKQTGTWGTTLNRQTGGIDGDYCLRFIAASQSVIRQQFDSTESDGSVATAGTTAALSAFTGYTFNVWMKAVSSAPTAGTITVSLVDSTDTVINDEAGTANSTAIASTTLTTSWAAFPVQFRTPRVLPTDGIVRLKVDFSAANDKNVLFDWAAMCRAQSLYPGGPNVAVFSDPAAPVEAGPDPDGFTLTFTNNRGGASYGATFQTLFSRLFQTPTLILPYDASPSFADTLITGA